MNLFKEEATIDYLISGYIEDSKNNSLNYNWEIRVFLKKNKINKQDKQVVKSLKCRNINQYLDKISESIEKNKLLFLYFLSRYSYICINDYLSQSNVDRSLKAILQICNQLNIIDLSNKYDPNLDILSNIFNKMFQSGRNNLHCYDCGTTARGIFYSLIKEYRQQFYIKPEEIYRIRREYLSTEHQSSFDSLAWLMTRLRAINHPSVFIVGLKFGPDKFGHIFIIEKILINNKLVTRFYQSALNSYLLMDYLVNVGYLDFPDKDIDLDEFESDMLHLISVPKWSETENLLFVKWYAFYPQSKIDDTSTIRINSSYLIY